MSYGKFKDLTGLVFGRLTVICRSGKNKHNQLLWECLCSCGNKKKVLGFVLTRGGTRSCGCIRSEKSSARRKKHGMCGTKTYKSWTGMIYRCENPKSDRYSFYGGRGIKICSRWRNNFENFLDDMGPSPGRGFSVDRINNNGNYEPANCRWATHKEQMRNTRSNHMLTFNGKTKCISAFAEEYNMTPELLKGRIYKGWDVEQALTTPIGGVPL